MLSEWIMMIGAQCSWMCHHPARETSTTLKKLSDAMKYPGASEAFYAYLRAIADAYPDFNGNPPPMTTSKQDHIISTLPPLFQFIKDIYLIVKNHITDLPVQEFYRVYTSYCETHCITPLSKINASRILSNELGINSRKIRVGKTTPRVYSISREDLYKKFLTKKWIHETDEINIEGIDTPPPVPLKPDCLKVKPAPVINEDPIPEESPAPIKSDTDEPIDSFSDCYLSDEEPDQEDEPPAEEPALKAVDDYDVLDDLLSDSDFTTVNPAPEQQPESPAEFSASVTKPDQNRLLKNNPSLPQNFSASVTKPDPEPAPKEQPIPEPDTELEVDWDPEPKEGTRAHWAWHERHRWDRKPWVKNSKDQVFNDLHNTVEECPTTRIEDEYQYYLREVVDRFKDWIEYNGYLPKTPSRKELADLIRAYKEDH
ncbi:hypothetical protein GLOIN_2v1875323 [Rhizophagus irregularis DAOM 181602=DAOM 197198]|nr:hypothetical protein GLOIN_2v1875323 [Rhizophagus irregularis DAOM 181602=DAOM 197198]